MRSWRVAIASAIACAVWSHAGAALAALPETGCPGSWTGTGEATFYSATSYNACGLPLAPDEYVAAVAQSVYDASGSAVCGRCVEIAGPLGTIVARITDACVGAGCHEFDLSPNAFAAIGNPVDGIIPVAWQSVACDVPGPVSFFFETGSNAYYAKIQVRDHRYGIAGLELAESGGPFVDLPRTLDDAFEYQSSPGPIAAPLSFRLTDLHGATFEETEIAYTPGAEVAGSGQFPFCPEPDPLLAGLASLAALGIFSSAARLS